MIVFVIIFVLFNKSIFPHLALVPSGFNDAKINSVSLSSFFPDSRLVSYRERKCGTTLIQFHAKVLTSICDLSLESECIRAVGNTIAHYHGNFLTAEAVLLPRSVCNSAIN